MLLVDYYHLALEKEDADIILSANKYIKHVHLSKPDGRVFPKATDRDVYEPFFYNLKKIGYNQRISVEAYTTDFGKDAATSLALLRKIFIGYDE